MGVTFFIAPIISCFLVAFIVYTFLLFHVEVDNLVAAIRFVDAAGTCTVVDVTIFAPPLRLAGAVVVSNSVDAVTFVLARIIRAFVTSVLFASFASSSSRTATTEVFAVVAVDAGPPIAARGAVAWSTRELAIGTEVAWLTSTMV